MARKTTKKAATQKAAEKKAPKPKERPLPTSWADRGWYLALEYGVLARDRFLKRLPALRELGRFQELLEPGGAILYRNLFRVTQVKEAWEALTALSPWKDRVTCYLSGHEIPLREVHEILWCAGFLRSDSVCRGGSGDRDASRAKTFVGCPGAQIRLSAGTWDLDTPERRHAVQFAQVNGEGVFAFDREAIAAFVATGPRRRLCPASPAADPAAFAEAFVDVPALDLGWSLVAEIDDPLAKRLGEGLLAEQGLTLKKGTPEPPVGTEVEVRLVRKKPVIRLVDAESPLGATVRLHPNVEEALREGVFFRGLITGEGYVRRDDGHYDHELRFVLAKRVSLDPSDSADHFRGYRFETFPRNTPRYEAWTQQVVRALGGCQEGAGEEA